VVRASYGRGAGTFPTISRLLPSPDLWNLHLVLCTFPPSPASLFLAPSPYCYQKIIDTFCARPSSSHLNIIILNPPIICIHIAPPTALAVQVQGTRAACTNKRRPTPPSSTRSRQSHTSSACPPSLSPRRLTLSTPARLNLLSVERTLLSRILNTAAFSALFNTSVDDRIAPDLPATASTTPLTLKHPTVHELTNKHKTVHGTKSRTFEQN
jgi:hypothetical protein